MTSRFIVVIVLSVLMPLAVSASEVVLTLDWEREPVSPPIFVLTEAGQTSIRVSHDGEEPLQVQLVEIGNPPIATQTWALRGRARFEGLADGSYLEMWSHFADGEQYFSRAEARQPDRGEWYDIVIPFFCSDQEKTLEGLVLNMHFAGPGTLDLGPLEVVQYQAGEQPHAVADQWWSARQAGLFGGILGGLFGACGALVGLLAATGRYRTVAINLLRATALIGMLGLVLATIALVKHQPYAVWYPPAMLGFLMAVLGLALNPIITRVYNRREEHRMRAMDEVSGRS